MLLNTAEQVLWDEHKDFFAPNGVPNAVAYTAYLGKYAQLGEYNSYIRYDQQQLLGVLLKQAPDAAVATAFFQYYSQFRTGSNSVEFDAWLSDMGAHRPELTDRCLKAAAPALNFTQQVMVLRDVQKLFPGRNIKDYAPPKLLKTKPNVILKQFNPTLPDMPYLLAMSASLMANDDPQSKALGDTIVRGSFIARYGMDPQTDDGRYGNPYNRPSVKYCTTEAFAMLLRHGIDMDPGTLLQQVQLRYNASSVMFDALAYPLMVLEDKQSTPESCAYAMAVFNEVLTFSEASASHPGFGTKAETNANHPGFGPTAEAAFASMHGLLHTEHPQLALRIENLMEEHMRVSTQHGRNSARTYPSVLSTVMDKENGESSLLLPLARRVMRGSPDAMAFLLHHTADVDMDIFNSGRCDPRVRNAFFALLAPSQMDEYLVKALRAFFKDTKKPEERTQSLNHLLGSFSEFSWSDAQKEAFKKSALAPTVILLYLYMTAAGHAKNAELTHSYGLPFTQWKPLPFLQKLYPENQDLWNQMTIGLLQMPRGTTEAAGDVQYQRVMGSMFQAFSQAFLADAPSLSITKGIIESLDANPLDYFLDAHKKAVPQLDLELPEGMFDFA